MFAQIAGLIIVDMSLMVLTIVLMLALDAALIIAGRSLFQRETILTRWK
jgi:hypothetical protein